MPRMSDADLKKLVTRLNVKREALLFNYINCELKRREAQRAMERRMRLRAKQGYVPKDHVDPGDTLEDFLGPQSVPAVSSEKNTATVIMPGHSQGDETPTADAPTVAPKRARRKKLAEAIAAG